MEHFWSKVDQSEGPDACWPWTAARHERGYGLFSIDGKLRTAQAVALELHTGEKADGRHGLHSCDNPPCCNPAHLFWGSRSDNMSDMHQKQRHPRMRGASNGAAKLCEGQIDLVRASPKSARALAKELGVNRATIDAVRAGKTWVHV